MAILDHQGQYMLVGNQQEPAELWDVTQGITVTNFPHNDDIIWGAFSPDDNYLITAAADDTARLWEIPSGREIVVLEHGDEVSYAAFNSTGTMIATASRDETARLWDLAGNEFGVFTHEVPVFYVEFEDDDTILHTIGVNNPAASIGSATQVDNDWEIVPLDQIATAALNRISRGLTATECDRYF